MLDRMLICAIQYCYRRSFLLDGPQTVLGQDPPSYKIEKIRYALRLNIYVIGRQKGAVTESEHSRQVVILVS